RFIAKFKGARVPWDRASAIILAPNPANIRGGATTEGGPQPPSLWQNREPNGSRLRLTHESDVPNRCNRHQMRCSSDESRTAIGLPCRCCMRGTTFVCFGS